MQLSPATAPAVLGISLETLLLDSYTRRTLDLFMLTQPSLNVLFRQPFKLRVKI